MNITRKLFQAFISRKLKRSFSSLCATSKIGFICEEEGAYKLYSIDGEKVIGLLVMLSNKLDIKYIPNDTVFIPIFLFSLGMEKESELVKIMHSYPYCFLVDYRVPERNIDIPAFWIHYLFWSYRLTSKKKEQFQNFIIESGIEGFIKRNQLKCVYRKTVLLGAATIALIESYCNASSFLINAESGTTVFPGITTDSG